MNDKDQQRSKLIATLNDQVRRGTGLATTFHIAETNPHHIVRSAGVAALPPEDQFAIYGLVRDFDGFDEGDDPYGEHDFGTVEHGGHKVFWKIDYYAPDLKHGSENPTDPAQTVRVLTIMLAEEY